MIFLDSIFAERALIGVLTGFFFWVLYYLVGGIVRGFSSWKCKAKQKKKIWTEVKYTDMSLFDKSEQPIIVREDNETQNKNIKIDTDKMDEEEPFILPKRIMHFDVLKKCENALKTNKITKEEEADYLIQLMEQRDELIQEGKLCPKCNALNTIRNHYCYVCKQSVKHF